MLTYLSSTNVSDPYFILYLSNSREVNVSEAASMSFPCTALVILLNLLNLLNLLLLVVRDDAQVEPTVCT